MKDFNTCLEEIGEVGFVDQVNHSIAYIKGLPSVSPGELVYFETGGLGQALTINAELVEVLTFAKDPPRVGTRVARTGKMLEVPVGPVLLGQVVDTLCSPLYQSVSWERPVTTRPIDVVPAGISHRKKIKSTLHTGVAMVDLVVPLGKGQRELVIGDRKTGKTTFLLQAALSQAKRGAVCIYASIGKKQADTKGVEEYFTRKIGMKNIVIVASGSQDPAGMIYLTPFTAMTIAEYFRDQNRETVVILDDLLTHAKFYREISLLGKRFPGRESYPGDIFYLHSRLLERAGNFLTQNSEVPITCLPVVESTEGDLTGYIQTNLMSMTDGHIFFDSDLFVKGRRPAVNPFLSVTRVGRQTQSQTGKDISHELSSLLVLFEKSEGFAHFGAELSEGMKLTRATGKNVYNFFSQSSEEIIPESVQFILFALLWIGYWQDRERDKMREQIHKMVAKYEGDQAACAYLDSLFTGVTTFNSLLAKVRTEQNKIVAYFK